MHPESHSLAQEQAATAGASATYAAENRILWSGTEGQVCNAGVFFFAALTFWLVLPVFYALVRYLRTANHRYTLTDQRLLEESGIWVKQVDSLELYRIHDLRVESTVMQTVFGRGRVVLQSGDTTNPTLTINAIPNPVEVAQQLRNAVERCRVAKGVRAFDH